jgi:hypothetical protein
VGYKSHSDSKYRTYLFKKRHILAPTQMPTKRVSENNSNFQ